MICHINIYFYYSYSFWYDIFLLDCNKIHKKQKFSANDIAESGSKEIWLVSYVPCVDTIAQVSLTQWFFR